MQEKIRNEQEEIRHKLALDLRKKMEDAARIKA